jgi:biotin carboxyl carrier protein
MKYCIINADGREVSFDLSVIEDAPSVTSFKVSNNVGVDKNFYVRSIAGKNFISDDKLKWGKLTKLGSKNPLVNITESLTVYRGFKPSGLSQAAPGEMVSQMPGKIVKINTTEGAVVHEGDTLIILEAMKMENEIKAGINGVVKAVHVTQGQVLESGFLMLEIES